MALELHIPPCVHEPPHSLHFPLHEKPVRVQIEGPLVAIQRLLPTVLWNTDVWTHAFPQVGGLELAKLAYRQIYGQEPRPEVARDLVVRDEYLGWVGRPPKPVTHFDYYGVTFDHLVPASDSNPEVLQINIIELEVDHGPYADGVAYAEQHLLLAVDPAQTAAG
ncbi:hypothetical protein SPI_04185 [Niveomyces insectorum RCEF 264]|uniref:Uncharacterized protein n=1 Tax=Niveomyces insectorum RCEF 264 TaxID=1081102 RepID=A0A167VI62_9HYPO|nr:hypothetical protein SPI_04185 [Niveomyces insectorum RCEF 264]